MPENLLTGDDLANAVEGGAAGDLIYGYDPGGPQGTVGSISATRLVAGLDLPLFAAAPAGDLGRLFLVEKNGAIKILDLATGQVRAEPFLDLTGQILATGERGLLGLAFHPDYAGNGYFYVNLMRPDGDTEIRRYQVSADPNRADAASAQTVIVIDQPEPERSNHKAGWLGFGPDGYLYAALGDGGGGGDPDNFAQNPDSLLGKMLRLDVDADAFPDDVARNYAVPADNPFVGAAGADEIWALGLRNPWRPGFDRAMGDLYIADVGQNRWEEVNLGQPGANYEWRIREGFGDFEPGTPSGGGSLTAPIHVYEHGPGGRSVTGGTVYRGPAEGLHGDYFFADFITGQVFTLRFDGTSWVATDRTAQIAPDVGTIGTPASFGEDGAGNFYIVDIIDGEIFRLVPNAVSSDLGDELLGRGGNDMLFGGSGDDTLEGGSGDDELQGGGGSDRLRGGHGADLLIGFDGNDTLDGATDKDTMAGGHGDDSYFVNHVGDLVFESAGEGRDTVRSTITEQLADGVERLVLIGTDRIDGVGNSLDNVLLGNDGANLLSGLDGNDTLVWSASDRFDGGVGFDTLRVPGGGVFLDLRAVNNARILNMEAIDLTGSGDNTLRLALRDLLDLSSTTDTLRVEGDAGDELPLSALWMQGAIVTIGTNDYVSYTRDAGTLLVDTDITVT